MRLPRGSTTSFRRSEERFVERDSYGYGRRSEPRTVEYVEPMRRSRSRGRVVREREYGYVGRESLPRDMEYVEPVGRRSRSVVREVRY